jgi:outer membrane protein insertion porin family
MRRALGSLVAAFVVVGCASARPTTTAPVTAPKRAHVDTCGVGSEPIIPPSARLPTVEPPWGARVLRIEIVGADAVPRELITAQLALRQGAALDAATLEHDVRALVDLEAIETIRVDVERIAERDEVVVRYVLDARRVVGDVTVRWTKSEVAGHWVPLAKGELYDPARVARTRFDLERNLEGEGHLQAKVTEHHRAGDEPSAPVDVCFVVEPGPAFLIDAIAFKGNDAISTFELRPLLKSHEHRANERGKPYREDLLENDLLYVTALYYDRGFLEVKVGPPTTTTSVDEGHGRITVDIPIHEGPRYRVRALTFSGDRPDLSGEYRRLIGVRSGDLFARNKMVEGMEKIRAFHRERGEEADIEPLTNLDSPHGQVDLTLQVKVVKKKPGAKP